MQYWGSQFFRADWRGEPVKKRLRFDHYLAQPGRIGGLQRVDRVMNDTLIHRAEQVLHSLFSFIFCELKAAVQPVEDFHSVFVSLQSHDHQMKVLLKTYFSGF